jgi:OOP family OmpA-OmpF porin
MKLKSIISAGFIAGAAAFAATAQAEGWYIGADVGRSSVGTVYPGLAMTKSKDIVGGVFLGYQLNRNWGGEGFYTGGGKFEGTMAGGVGSGKSDVYGLDLIGLLPIQDTLSLYGRVGYANAKTSASSTPAGFSGSNRSAATYGIGGEYDLTQQVGVRLGWDRYGAALSNAGVTSNFNSNVWSLGILYKF